MPSSGVQTCARSEEHTSELQSLTNLVCRLLLEKKKELLRCSFCKKISPTLLSFSLDCANSYAFAANTNWSCLTHSSPTVTNLSLWLKKRNTSIALSYFSLLRHSSPTRRSLVLSSTSWNALIASAICPSRKQTSPTAISLSRASAIQ